MFSRRNENIYLNLVYLFLKKFFVVGFLENLSWIELKNKNLAVKISVFDEIIKKIDR